MQHRCPILRQATQAESRSSLATRLPRHEIELVEKGRGAPAAHCRTHGSFVVNSRRREKHEAKAGDAMGLTELEIVALRPSWCEIFPGKRRTGRKRKKTGKFKSLGGSAGTCSF